MSRYVAHEFRTLEKSTPTLLTGEIYISSVVLLDVPDEGVFIPKTLVAIVTMKWLIFSVS